MPRKFFNFSKGNGPKSHTKPITRQYFTGPSHWLDSKGRTITAKTHPKYVNPDTKQLDVWRLENAQRAGKVNRFPDYAGRYVNPETRAVRDSMAVTIEQALWHLRNIAFRKIKVQALTFEVKMAKEAVEVFQRSFTDRKFRNWGSKPWKKLAPYTIKRRQKFGTNPNRILWDTGTMKKSIKAVEGKGLVRTDPSAYGTARRHKGVCYAGIHNDPQFFGATNVAARNHEVVQRQFIGHSSYLREKGWALTELYLFDELFTPIV